MKKWQSIFLNIFIALCVIGFFAAIFLGEGYGYTPKSKVWYVTDGTSSLKTKIEKQVIAKHPVKNIDISKIRSLEYVSYVNVSTAGEITIFLQEIGTLVVLSPVESNGAIVWKCNILPYKNTPEGCRQ